MLASPCKWSSFWTCTRCAKSCSVDSATNDVGDISRINLEFFAMRSLRKIRPAMSRKFWYCLVNKLASAGDWEVSLFALAEAPFDLAEPLVVEEPLRAFDKLFVFFVDELFFTNKFQDEEGVLGVQGTESNPRE